MRRWSGDQLTFSHDDNDEFDCMCKTYLPSGCSIKWGVVELTELKSLLYLLDAGYGKKGLF